MDGDRIELAEVQDFVREHGYGTALTKSGVKIYFFCDDAPWLFHPGQKFAATYGLDRWCVDTSPNLILSIGLTTESESSNIEIVE